STVTVTGDPSADIGEMFEFIKIETTGTGTEFMESDDPEQTEQAFESARRYLAANGGAEEPSAWENLVGIYNEAVRQQAESMEVESILPKSGQGTLKSEKTLELGESGDKQLIFGFELPYDYEFNFYRDHVNVYVLFKIHCTISPSFTLKLAKDATENSKIMELNPDKPYSALLEKINAKVNDKDKDDSDALIRKTIPLCAGLDLLFEVNLTVAVSGQIQVGWSKEMTVGQAFLEGICYPISDVKPLKWTKTNVQGEVEMSLDINFGVVLMKLVDLKIRVTLGFDVLAEVSLMNKKHCKYGTPAAKSTMFMPFYETDEPSVHACDMGLDLKVDAGIHVGAVLAVGFKLPEKVETAALKHGFVKLFNVFAKINFEKELTLFETNYHIGDYHVMSNKGGKYAGLHFVAQPCPNVAYRTTFKIQFTNIPPEANAAIRVDGDLYEVPITPNTQMNFYAAPGKHDYFMTVDSKQRAAGSFTVQNEPVTIDIPVTDSIDDDGGTHPEPSNPTTSTGPAVPAVTTTVTTPVTFQTATAPAIHPGYINTELIQFGDGIFGTLSANGVLSISGSGDMYDDMTSSPVKNVKDVRLIVMMDADEEHGYVINTIGPHAFDGMENAEIAYLPRHITAIGDSAFRNCSSLKYLRYGGEYDTSTTFILPTNLTKIGNEAFSGCKSAVFGDVVIPKTVTTIGYSAFSDCFGITSVLVPDDAQPTVCGSAFNNCAHLKKAVLEKGVQIVGAYIFSMCFSLEDITIPNFNTPEGFQSTKGHHFYDYFGYYRESFDLGDQPEPVLVFNDSVWGHSERYYIPSTLRNVTVLDGTEIPNAFFTALSVVENITIPEDVTAIGEYAFYNCSALKEIELPEVLETIGREAFSGCKSVDFGRLFLPETIRSVGNHAFSQCSGLTEIIIPGDSEVKMDASAFNCCENLKKAVICDGVQQGSSMFIGCFSLESIAIPNCTGTEPLLSTIFNIPRFYDFFGRYLNYKDVPTYAEYERIFVTNDKRDFFCLPKTLNQIIVTGGEDIPESYFALITPPVSVVLPYSAKTVLQNAFKDSTALEEACLIAEEGDWDDIDITETGNETLLNSNKIYCPVMVLADPADRRVNAGKKAVFRVAATGKNALRYQWQYSDDEEKTWTDADCTEKKYVFEADAAMDGRLVRCIVTDEKGNKQTTESALLTVRADKTESGNKKPEGYCPGDADGNGVVDVSDAVLLARFCVEDRHVKITDLGLLNADVNGDGQADMEDQTLIVLYIAKRFKEFPVEKT
ncbi:MAG: leucine-rich repeat protein, partial [Oscillospiraceae bacterium]|nr:leucine-rich repeat protein [Oscillospiraceae bacterium]